MRIFGKKILIKLKLKNKGNRKLCDAVDKLVEDLEQFDPRTSKLAEIRKDADCVHSDGFYFLNIHVHRTFVLIDFDEEGEATIIWAGTHDEYERTFRNNKVTIEKWLRNKEYIN
ncbi:type II toxin-antitoxin system HigB family toxin [Chitinophaga sp. sic0106]|uniref:type II toxin-antitoxin system HigB family toxin n=1 Tax=Chitinophaga sp. sic0106 TaxID=2854785 RepID=UPI001C45D239|nr:type II toxin-antitoxin system HigB family toxin [Chitinophaga sp. sic0106]MBV7533000.1 type II toxin-antitoxin system HigB family toxin [Chitinophaga sp. sic0106]